MSKEELKNKLATPEAVAVVAHNLGHRFPSAAPTPEGHKARATIHVDVGYYKELPINLGFKENTRSATWWAYREHLRLSLGIYSTTSVLQTLNSLVPIYAHISTEDANMCAYTPDKAFGERDAQLKLTIGRLLTRFYPGLADEAIEEMTNTHKSEASDEIEILPYDKIVEAYTSYAGTSLGSCMSKHEGYWDYGNPIQAYAVPGAFMIQMRNAKGDVCARTLAYCPTEEDKRFIRVYGDATLTKRLYRHGFVPGTWHGFEFNTVRTTEQNGYLLPYIEGNGGMGSNNVSAVALLGGKLTSVSISDSQKLQKVFPKSVYRSCLTSGFVDLLNVPQEALSIVDPLNPEETISIFKMEGANLIWYNGELKYTRQPLPDYVFAGIYRDGTYKQVMARLEDTIRTVCGNLYVKDEATVAASLCQLSAKHYPEGSYARQGNASNLNNTGWVLSKDLVSYVNVADGLTRVHTSAIVKTGPMKLRDRKVGDGYVHPAVPLYVTPAGRYVHPNLCTISQRWDGMWDFNRNLKTIRLGQRSYLVNRAEKTSIAPGSTLRKHHIAEVIQHIKGNIVGEYESPVGYLYKLLCCAFGPYDTSCISKASGLEYNLFSTTAAGRTRSEQLEGIKLIQADYISKEVVQSRTPKDETLAYIAEVLRFEAEVQANLHTVEQTAVTETETQPLLTISQTQNA